MRVLIVEDDVAERDYIRDVVSAWGHEARTAADGMDAMEALESFAAAVMITDLKMPRMDGFELMKRLRDRNCLPPAIVLTAFGSLDLAVSTIHDLGGFWFLEKPVEIGALQVLLERAGAQSRLEEENRQLRRELTYHGVIGELVGQSERMKEIFAIIRQVAPTDAAVFITGESGTGKELLARAVHKLSSRSEGPFIAINCAALPETLMESEMFGHERGAFTGAHERRAGCIELANRGTLFLDELGEMPLQMQAKLLRVLEDFRFRRLGGKQEIEVDIRVIAATNRSPDGAIKDGKLREDLYYRLNVFHLNLPPLRERLDDLPLLVDALISTLNGKHNTKIKAVSPAALELLATRRWSGNVRELRNILERAVIIAGTGVLDSSHFYLADPPKTASVQRPVDGGLGIHVGMTIDDAERSLIEATLQHAGNNKTRAALTLGISAKTLHAKLKQYQLSEAESAPEQEPQDA